MDEITPQQQLEAIEAFDKVLTELLAYPGGAVEQVQTDTVGSILRALRAQEPTTPKFTRPLQGLECVVIRGKAGREPNIETKPLRQLPPYVAVCIDALRAVLGNVGRPGEAVHAANVFELNPQKLPTELSLLLQQIEMNTVWAKGAPSPFRAEMNRIWQETCQIERATREDFLRAAAAALKALFPTEIQQVLRIDSSLEFLFLGEENKEN